MQCQTGISKGATDNFVFESVESFKAATSITSLWHVFLERMACYGFSHSMYAAIPDARFFPLESFIQRQVAYPVNYIETYDELDHIKCDPTIRHCMTKIEPLQWFDENFMETLSPKQVEIENIAGEFGLLNGMTIPLRFGAQLDVAGLSLSAGGTTKSEYDCLIKYKLPEILRTVEVFHAQVLEASMLSEAIKLTKREIEVLTWSSLGLNRDDVADRIGLSSRTVRLHLEKCKIKMKARTVNQAVARAFSLGIINI